MATLMQIFTLFISSSLYCSVRGDVIRVVSDNKGIHIMHGETCLKTYGVDINDLYSVFVGLNNKFEKVTLLRNKCFSEEHTADPGNLSRNLMRVLVTSMNEGSPKYGEVRIFHHKSWYRTKGWRLLKHWLRR